MKTCKCCGESKSVSQFYAAKSNGDGLATSCKVCYRNAVKARYNADPVKARAMKKSQRKENPAKYKAIQLKYYERNRSAICEKKRQYVENNKGEINAKKRSARLADPERAAELKRAEYARNADKYREYRKRYYESNKDKARAAICASMSATPEKYRAHKMNRKARKASATPSWFSDFDTFVVEEAYALAERRYAVIGGEWQVDHIIPLTGRNVCGLHVGTNLQVIPATANNRKRNRFDPSAHSEVRESVFVGV